MEGDLMIHSGVNTGTPAKIPFGSGVYFQGITYDEKVAPTEAAIKAAIIGATQDGGSVNITPEIFVPELDGVHVKIKETQIKVGETATMETSFAELTADLAMKTVIGELKESTDKSYDVITSSTDIEEGHFYEGFGFYGQHLDGRPLIIIFKNALCTSGFSFEPKNKTNSVFKGTFECISDSEYSTVKLPYAIFIKKTEGWTAVDPDEVAAE